MSDILSSWKYVAVILCVSVALADGPADNIPNKVRRIPKLGVEVPAEVRADLEAGLKELDALLQPLERPLVTGAGCLAEFCPDVRIYHKAVHDALKYQEFFDAKEFKIATELLAEGKERAKSLAAGETPWLKKPGPTVRGYLSKIDGSVQPYGLVIPAGYESYAKTPRHYRLDFWFHGRGETLSELNFLNDRRKNPGQFTPKDTFVLHPYGRYCNANKFAGEIDGLEALAAVRANFAIDENRINVRGFSMGGAACWQFATHYSDRWCSAAPGAGFSETPQFLKVFQKEELKPTWWEHKLWHWYDCTDWAGNLTYLPTVAYSGEKDVQKQAADIMAVAMQREGLELKHIIGPNTGHSYEAKAKEEINRLIDGFNEAGRPSLPPKVRLVTHTLRYNQAHWLNVTGLKQHWERCDVRGEIKERAIHLQTENATAVELAFAAEQQPTDLKAERVSIMIDDQTLSASGVVANQPWKVSLRRVGEKWELGELPSDTLRKQQLLQGPIDDAFMDAFIFVRPTGKAMHPAIQAWTEAELARAIEHWRRQFRGEARVVNDHEITEDDIANKNLILWGDAQSNAITAKIVGKLPIGWNGERIQAGEKSYPAWKHALIAIYPNPLNPQRYVVLNSSFTYRDYAYLNNARQVPMLPDWAVVDLSTPPNAVWPGKIVDADFFGENWEFKRTPLP